MLVQVGRDQCFESTARVLENAKTAIDNSAHPQLGGAIRKTKALSNAMDREKRKTNRTTGRVPTEPQDIIDSLPDRLVFSSPFAVIVSQKLSTSSSNTTH